MKHLLSLVVLASLAFSVTAEKARFDNYRVYSIEIDTHDQLSVLRELSATSDSYSFWDEPISVNSKLEIIVPPHKFADFSEITERFGFNVELTNSNLQESIDKESPTRKQPKVDGEITWDEYYSLNDIYSWLDAIQAEFPNWITVEQIGTSYEGRPLKVVKLSKREGNRAIFIEANIHAREWISSATATYVLNQLLRSNDPEVQAIAESIDWYIVPVQNPDGYEYTRSDNRNWRKSRSPVSLICFGVDPNRNFAFNWLVPDSNGNLGASTNPCSDTYAGPSPLNEAETAALDAYLSQHHDKFDIYLALHSYAHQILIPFGNTAVRVPNYAMLEAIGNAAGDRLFATNGIRYQVGIWHQILYPSSGVSVDHAYGQYGIPIGYTYEMRGNGVYGNHGFVLPPEFIVPNGNEVLQSFIGMVSETRQYGYLQ